jgi:hypothetical protein
MFFNRNFFRIIHWRNQAMLASNKAAMVAKATKVRGDFRTGLYSALIVSMEPWRIFKSSFSMFTIVVSSRGCEKEESRLEKIRL